jgi:hypothetical protein
MGVLRLGAAAVTAAAGLVAATLHGPPATPAPTPFGGAAAVRIPHVGRIEIDLETGGVGRLQTVACAAAPVGTTCFVAR